MQKIRCYVPQCESKVESGILTKADVEASMNIASIAESNKEIDDFTLYSCREFEGNFVLSLAKYDIMVIRKSRTLYRILQEQFNGKIWLVESDETDKRFIEDLFFPIRILSVNAVWVSGENSNYKGQLFQANGPQNFQLTQKKWCK